MGAGLASGSTCANGKQMAQNRLYVGNLPYKTAEADLQDEFAKYGTVLKTTIVTDRETGRSRGFGFVEMSSDAEAQAAIDALNGQDFGGRQLQVNIARPREDRGPRRGGFRNGRDRGPRGDW